MQSLRFVSSCARDGVRWRVSERTHGVNHCLVSAAAATRLRLARVTFSTTTVRRSDADSNKAVLAELKALRAQVDKFTTRLKTFQENTAANALVSIYASRSLAAVNMKENLRIFSQFSFKSPVFCHNKLPTILAHFIVKLDTLPSGLHAMPSILALRDILLGSFKKLVACEIPITEAQISHFIDVCEKIETVHTERNLLLMMANGILELKDHMTRHRSALEAIKSTVQHEAFAKALNVTKFQLFTELQVIQEPMNLCNRCMITYNFLSRMLMSLDSNKQSTDRKRVGLVDLAIDLERVVRIAVDEARNICNDHYGDCPDTVIVLAQEAKMPRFPYMSTTIHYVVVELMKNALRATVEGNMKRNSLGIVTCDDMPPVRISIHLNDQSKYACVCISDEGKGMTYDAQQLAMAYSYTSVKEPVLQSKEKKDTADHMENVSPLAGYGYGLPMSRVYARAFGGDLLLRSMEGYGTRVYYYINLT